MDLRKITDEFSVSPQIECEDVPAIAQAGYRSILCNRPDDEQPGQCTYDDIAAAAETAGIKARSVPIVSGVMRPQDVDAFKAALDEMPKPILAYCRSGTRSTMLWSVAQIDRMPSDQIVRAAADAGYDVSGLLRQMQQGQ